MYPIVKFTHKTDLDFSSLISSLFDHYSKHYLNKVATDYPIFDNLSKQQIENLWDFSGCIQDHFSIDLQYCIEKECGKLSNDNREIYLKHYFENNKKFRSYLKEVGI